MSIEIEKTKDNINKKEIELSESIKKFIELKKKIAQYIGSETKDKIAVLIGKQLRKIQDLEYELFTMRHQLRELEMNEIYIMNDIVLGRNK